MCMLLTVISLKTTEHNKMKYGSRHKKIVLITNKDNDGQGQSPHPPILTRIAGYPHKVSLNVSLYNIFTDKVGADLVFIAFK